MITLKGRRVLVMGLGLFGGGVGAARFLVREGAEVVVTDLRPAKDLGESLAALETLPILLKLGGHDAADFWDADLIVANPAVPRSSPFLKVAEAAGVPVTTEICLFVERCPAPVVAVTGTSGKTTTTSLIAAMLRRVDGRTLVGGNIGGSLLEHLGAIEADSPVVLELSSFQLDRLGDLRWSPQTAVVTNFAPNHLDVHGSLAAYRRAKMQIVAHQGPGDVAVLNADDEEVLRWAETGAETHLLFSVERRLQRGIFLDDDDICSTLDGKVQRICPAAELGIPGRHNLANALAATGAALNWGVPEGEVAASLRSFPGVEHRLEYVDEVDGVRYYNDSIATSPDRTRVALEAFLGAVVLIAGGYDKGLSYADLGPLIAQKVAHLIVLGKTGDAIAASVPAEASVFCHRVESLPSAVALARDLARPGQVVVLSPASASYDMFLNFEERGRLFKTWVTKIKKGKGCL